MKFFRFVLWVMALFEPAFILAAQDPSQDPRKDLSQAPNQDLRQDPSHPAYRIFATKSLIFVPKQDLNISLDLGSQRLSAPLAPLLPGYKTLFIAEGNASRRLLRLYVDAFAPKIYIYSAKKPLSAGAITATPAVKIKVLDSASGVWQSFYELNGAPAVAFASGADLNLSEGENHLRIWAFDNVGNFYERNISARLDTTPPVTSLASAKILARGQKLELESDDKTSKIYYKILSQKEYRAPVNLARLAEGNHTVSFFGVDALGNREPAKTESFYIDATPPVCTVKATAYGKDGKFFMAGDANFTLECTDETALQDAAFGANGKRALQVGASDLNASSDLEPSLDLSYTASDLAGNVKKGFVRVTLDRDPPVCLPALVKAGDFYYARAGKNIHATCNDASEISKILYYINGKQANPGALLLDADANLTITAADVLGNEASASYTIKIDNSPLNFKHYFTHAGAVISRRAAYPKNTVFHIEPASKMTVFFRVNNGKKLEYLRPLHFKKSGTYTLWLEIHDANQTFSTYENLTVE